jgi:hypothetical protein
MKIILPKFRNNPMKPSNFQNGTSFNSCNFFQYKITFRNYNVALNLNDGD